MRDIWSHFHAFLSTHIDLIHHINLAFNLEFHWKITVIHTNFFPNCFNKHIVIVLKIALFYLIIYIDYVTLLREVLSIPPVEQLERFTDQVRFCYAQAERNYLILYFLLP